MSLRAKLFGWRDPYDLAGTDALFTAALRENALFHYENCPEYRAILLREGFSPGSLRVPADLHRLPPLPTLYFKRHALFSIPERRRVLRSTSSGTTGQMSRIAWEWQDCLHALRMVLRVTRRHGLLSPLPTNPAVKTRPQSPKPPSASPFSRRGCAALMPCAGGTAATPSTCPGS